MLKKWFSIRKDIERKYYITLGVSSFVIIIAAWIIANAGGLVDELFLPAPFNVVKNILNGFITGTIWPDMWISIYRIMLGFLLAVVIGIPLGILIGTFKSVEAFLQPVAEFIRYMPVPAFIPLIMMWVGIGENAKIAVIFVGIFFQLILMVADDVRLVPNDLLNAGYTLGASNRQSIFKILIPAMMPKLMDTLRVLLGWAWTYVTVAELVAANSGLGYSILKAQRFLKTDSIFAGILIIGFLGLIFDRILGYLNKRIFYWVEK